MSKILTAALVTMISLSAFATSGETHPIPFKERLKWQMWVNGIPEFKQPMIVVEDRKTDDLKRVIAKLKL